MDSIERLVKDEVVMLLYSYRIPLLQEEVWQKENDYRI